MLGTGDRQPWIPGGILEGMPGVNDNCGNNSPPVGPGLHSLRGPAEPLLWGTAAASDGGVFHAGCEPARNHDHLTESSPRSAGRCHYHLHLVDEETAAQERGRGLPRVSQPGARGARHKSQKHDGGAVTPAGASWLAVGGRAPPLSETIHLPGSGLGLLHILGFITPPYSPRGMLLSPFPCPEHWGHSPGVTEKGVWSRAQSLATELIPVGKWSPGCSAHLAPCTSCLL